MWIAWVLLSAAPPVIERPQPAFSLDFEDAGLSEGRPRLGK